VGWFFLQEADITKVDEIEKAVEGTVAWLKETGSALAGVDLQHQKNSMTTDDLDQSISTLRWEVENTDDGDPKKPIYLSDLALCQRGLFERLGELGDIQDSISNLQNAIKVTDDGNPNKPRYLLYLAVSQEILFEHLGKLGDIQDCVSSVQKAIQLTDDGNPNKPSYLECLGVSQRTRFECFGEL